MINKIRTRGEILREYNPVVNKQEELVVNNNIRLRGYSLEKVIASLNLIGFGTVQFLKNSYPLQFSKLVIDKKEFKALIDLSIDMKLRGKNCSVSELLNRVPSRKTIYLDYYVEGVADKLSVYLKNTSYGICPICKQKLHMFNIDHIVAKSKGGNNHPYNLIRTHFHCNSVVKNDKDLCKVSKFYTVGSIINSVSGVEERTIVYEFFFPNKDEIEERLLRYDDYMLDYLNVAIVSHKDLVKIKEYLRVYKIEVGFIKPTLLSVVNSKKCTIVSFDLPKHGSLLSELLTEHLVNKIFS